MTDRFKLFGLFAVALSVFFMGVVAQGSGRVLFAGGVGYGLVLIFHRPLTRWVDRHVTQPLRAYGIAVLVNGMTMEVLAYLSNLDAIAQGRKVALFSQESLLADLALGLPFYAVLAGVYCWAVRRYVLSAVQLGLLIFLFWAISVDEFAHARALLAGHVLEFCLAGFLMLCTLHAPIVIFDEKLRQVFPDRKTGWPRFVIVFFLQALAMAAGLIAAFIRHNVLHV